MESLLSSDNKENSQISSNTSTSTLTTTKEDQRVLAESISKENTTTDTSKDVKDEKAPTPSSSVSLQDRFKKFKKERHEKFKYNQYLKNIKIKDRSTKEFQDYLRNKFVETAKKYLGVPYAKR